MSIAFSLSDSSKSLASASMGQNIASVVVHELSCLISFGVTTSTPNKSLKGVEFVAMDTEVLWLQTAFGITSAYLPFFSPSRHFLIASKIKAFARSTALLDCG
jgi:hypothetical protein